jgi:photosystem II stability/assembly factor-like uncharacterized protein
VTLGRFRTRLFVTRLENRLAPSGAPTQWQVRGSGGGGALFSPQFNPANPNDIYIASDMSEVFHTTNAGASWQMVDFRQLQGGHEARVQFTEDPNIRYSIDYSNVDGGDLVRPSKSTDGGQTWQSIASDPTFGGAFYLFADPTNHNRLVVTDYVNLYFSNDGGQTWAQRFKALDGGAGVLIGGAFWDGQNIYFGTNYGILASNNGGQSFSLLNVGGIPAGQSMLSFAGARVGTTTRFVAVTWSSVDVFAGVAGYDNFGGANVLTLDLGAANWTLRNLGTTAWPFYAGMAGNDVSTMYVAGGSTAASPTVYKSTNGGATWTSVLNTAGNANVATGWSGSGGDRDWSYGEMALGFTVSSSDPSKLIITDFGFAHASTDGGATWQALYVPAADRNAAGATTPKGRPYHDTGLDNTTSWNVAWADATHVFIGNADVRGQLSVDGGQTFGYGYTGHTRNSMYRVATAANGTIYGAAGSVHDLYQSTYLQDVRIDGGNGAVLFSTDKGVTWQTLHDFNDVVSWVAVDPNNANRLYASVVNSTAGGIYVTNNLSDGAGSTWTKLTNPPRTEGHPLDVVVLNDGTLVVSFSARRNSVGAFTASSGVFVSTDGGQTWADRGDAGMRYWTWDVVVDPFDATQSTWYAGVFSGWGGPPNDLGGLYKTTNRGVSWTRVLALDGVTSVTFNPSDQNEAYMTTETRGLWFSSNMRAATPTFAAVASYPFRQPERVFFNPYNPSEVWVTSFGGGVRVGTTAAAPAPQVASFRVNDGSAQRSMVTSLTVTFSSQVTLAPGAFILTPQGGLPVAPSFTTAVNNGATVATITFGGSLADGRYTLTTVASLVRDLTGIAMAADRQDALFRLFGDVNGDAVVNGTDLTAFRNAFGASSADTNYAWYLDSSGDGVINGTDLTAFRTHFGVVLP